MDERGPLYADPEAVARAFHEAYERLAPTFGYATREASAKPWEQVPENNRALMRAVAAELLAGVVFCACEAWPPQGPSADCPVHGAIRGFNEASRELAEVRTQLAAANATIARARALDRHYHECEGYFAYADWDELQEALAGPEEVPGA